MFFDFAQITDYTDIFDFARELKRILKGYLTNTSIPAAHVCICFVALKVYKELYRTLKLSDIRMSVDKVLALAQTITTLQIRLPLSQTVYTKTMLMHRHMRIARLFDDDFWENLK